MPNETFAEFEQVVRQGASTCKNACMQVDIAKFSLFVSVPGIHMGTLMVYKLWKGSDIAYKTRTN